MKKLLVYAAISLTMTSGMLAQETEPAEKRDARMKWWVDARFGMFIHWDMSSIPGTEISWSRKGSKPLDITGDKAGYVEDPIYDNLYKQFNPTKFDANEWVILAKKAGMKYLVFTAKHHGGFCMWDTKQTDYSIMNTPFKRDVLKELAEACRRNDMRFGLYYSQRDWHHPDYGVADNTKYVNYMNAQVRELLTNYGKIDIIWWDSYGKGDLVNFWKIGETFDLVKKLQPEIVMNNRMAVLAGYNRQPKPYIGDHDTPEQKLGSFQNTRPWESCMCMVEAKDGGWSYRPDGKVKSFEDCLRMLISCATGDGNLLLDVGPDSEGVIPADQQNVLKQFGEWMDKNGDTIYGTRGGPFRNGKWGGSTYKDANIFLHVSVWNGDKIVLPPLKAKILSCSADFEQKPDGITIRMPVEKQDKVNTIVRLKLDAPAAGEFINGSPLDVKTSSGKKKK
jgi:alpha-L-fucosidase